MPEIRIIPSRFAAIATCVPADPLFSMGFYSTTIHDWRPAADKVKVFGKPIELISGVSYVKSKNPRPTLKEVFQDHYGTNRSVAPLLLAVPGFAIKPVCIDIYEYAEKKKMALSWAFFAKVFKDDKLPMVFGLSPSVVKILSQETPEDILFDEPLIWRQWMADWINRYMLAHRVFDATDMGLVSKAAIALPAPEAVAVEEKPKKGKKKSV